jgi:hypothetical protein
MKESGPLRFLSMGHVTWSRRGWIPFWIPKNRRLDELKQGRISVAERFINSFLRVITESFYQVRIVQYVFLPLLLTDFILRRRALITSFIINQIRRSTFLFRPHHKRTA